MARMDKSIGAMSQQEYFIGRFNVANIYFFGFH